MWQWGHGGMMGYDGYWQGGYPMAFAGHWILFILFWGLVITALVLLIRYLWRGGPARPAEPAERGRALSILEERYARGEIDREEFLQRKRDLG